MECSDSSSEEEDELGSAGFFLVGVAGFLGALLMLALLLLLPVPVLLLLPALPLSLPCWSFSSAGFLVGCFLVGLGSDSSEEEDEDAEVDPVEEDEAESVERDSVSDEDSSASGFLDFLTEDMQ